MSGSPSTSPPPEYRLLDLGNSQELWRVPVSLPKEQGVNARVMSPDAFNRLSDNIKRSGHMESFAFCAWVDDGLEIVSGHHRIRAAKKAGLETIPVIVDVSGMTRDQLRSKQLSHNSLQGQDDSELVKKIFDAIQDSESRIESFIALQNLLPKQPLDLTLKALEIDFQPKVAVLAFLPAQFEVFKKAMQQLKDIGVDEAYLAAVEEYDTLMAAVDMTSATFKINSVPTIFAKMAEIVIQHCEQHKPPDEPKS